MAKREINLELLVGRRVYGLNGKSIGHLEEICAELSEGECLVTEYLVGASAVVERLAALSIGRAILRLFGATKKHEGYRVPWDKLLVRRRRVAWAVASFAGSTCSWRWCGSATAARDPAPR